MTPAEFLSYTSEENDVLPVQYVLDSRFANDQVEYLVRFNDKIHKYDEWTKASDLTCTRKILDYYDGKVPSTIVKNLKPESPKIENEPNIDDKFTIYGAEIESNNIMLTVHIPGEPGVKTVKSDDLKDKYSEEIAKYYETNYLDDK